MNALINKSTGFLIEAQENATEATLIQNAISSGFSAEDVEVRVMTEEEIQTLSETERTGLLTYADKRKAKYDLLNQFEMRFDDQANSTTTWVDAINAIKAAHPKP